jgi:hypothetical protein
MINISKVKTYSVKVRKSKVQISDFAKPPVCKIGFLDFYRSLQNQSFASDLDGPILFYQKTKNI